MLRPKFRLSWTTRRMGKLRSVNRWRPLTTRSLKTDIPGHGPGHAPDPETLVPGRGRPAPAQGRPRDIDQGQALRGGRDRDHPQSQDPGTMAGFFEVNKNYDIWSVTQRVKLGFT